VVFSQYFQKKKKLKKMQKLTNEYWGLINSNLCSDLIMQPDRDGYPRLPNGHVIFSFTKLTPNFDLKYSVWAWKVSNTYNTDDCNVVIKNCLGVDKCSCGELMRPLQNRGKYAVKE
jgi:hypothetical protein